MRARVLAGAALLACGATAWTSAGARQSLEARLTAALAGVRASRGGARAQSGSEAFAQVGIVNPSGKVVVALAPDDTGDGVVAVADRNEQPKAGALVDDDGAGVLVAFTTSGKGGHFLHGNLGLVSQAGDMAEDFPAADAGIPPGSVVAIDPERPGFLHAASAPYDKRVAGVAAGANDYNPGIRLRALADIESRVTVTLSGTVYCRATDANGPIRAGDLLTTSAVAGHAMRATDPDASRGAILGKAMEDLRGERGLILVLASLQ